MGLLMKLFIAPMPTTLHWLVGRTLNELASKTEANIQILPYSDVSKPRSSSDFVVECDLVRHMDNLDRGQSSILVIDNLDDGSADIGLDVPASISASALSIPGLLYLLNPSASPPQVDSALPTAPSKSANAVWHKATA